MTKQRFLEELQENLAGDVTSRIIDENLRFYAEYFDTEMAKGRSEDEINAELGGPNAIAKTILVSCPVSERTQEGNDDASNGSWSDEHREKFEEHKESAKQAMNDPHTRMTMNSIGCLIAVIIVLLILLYILGGMLHLVFSYPLIFIAAVVAVYMWVHFKR